MNHSLSCRVSPNAAPLLGALLLAASGLAPAAPVAREDRVVLRENAPPTAVAVLANDVFDPALMVDGELRISSPPMGQADVDTRGTETAVDDRLVYRPPVNFTGQDVFSYQTCESGSGGGCAESQVRITVRPAVDQYEDSLTGAGYADIAMAGLRSLPEAQFLATPLSYPAVDPMPLDVDPTPADIWDDGMAGSGLIVKTLPEPSNGVPQRFQVLVDAAGLDGDMDLYLGRDLNGNDEPDPGEILCTAAMTTVTERCEATIVHPANGMPVRYWILLHNRHDSSQLARAETFQMNLDRATDGSFVATGPGHVPGLEPFELRVSWNDAWNLSGESRVGFVRVLTQGVETGVVPVRIQRTSALAAPTLLGRGPTQLRLAAGAAQDRMFIDVPAGAVSMTVNTFSAQNIDLYLAHVPAPSSPLIEAAPARGQADAAATGPLGNESLTVSGAQLLPGRWYVTPVNADANDTSLTMQATIVGTDAPVVRSGSYFNPDRSGHGAFLYPAGDQWTGLWYTYFQDRTPTWYYLQGPQPGANGIWSSEVFRAAWDGDSRELTSVGRVTLTPTADDAFIWSYRIDGESGSESMQALGRGCPMLDGNPVDASSTWFDPTRAGTGHSVQVFDDYEYFASFVYDELGVPRFLTAERTRAGDAYELLDLEQLTGFCPLCERTGDPLRETIGVFSRSFENGTLTEVALAGVFTDGVPGTWSEDDEVEALGGPGTTQGCEP